MKPIQKSTAGRISWRRLPLLLLTLLASGLVQAELAVDRSTATTQDRPGVLRRAAPAAVKPVFAAGPDNAVLPLQDVDFRRGPDGVGRVLVSLSSSQVGVDVRQQGNKLVVDFLKTSLSEGLRRRLDVTDFGTPVQIVSTTQVGDRVRMVVEARGRWEHSVYQSDKQFVLEVREPKVDPNKLTQGPGYVGEKLTLNFQNIEVRSLLQVIADFTNFNIVTSDTVTGNVTLRLKDVPWDQALDIILQAKGLGMRKTGNVIWVAPKDEIAAREKQEFEAKAAMHTLEPVRTQSFQMNYAKAVDIAAQLRGEVTGQQGATSVSTGGARLLSPRGSAVPEPRTNQLFVTDIPSRLEAVQELIKKLDIPVRQVMIEARIVEASDTFGRSLGVKLGGSDLRGIRGGDAGYSIGGGNRAAFGGSYDAVSATTLERANTLTSANTQFVNLPASNMGGAYNPATLALSLFSPTANRFLDLEISALQADGKGKVVASPRVITADQTQAEIEQGVEIPYTSSAGGSAGATQVSFKKASLRLVVTPQITPDGGIILNVEVSKDTPGVLVPGGIAINTKRVKTNVLVENGGTVVIGGIFTSREQEDINKVPLLGDIPFAGNLFKSRTISTEKTELLVFLTPRTLSDVITSAR
ncbi:type IV pilus secretin PilQ [Malikia spinosa]|jgi:type IV pilus assembly protein PilQ|uniref:type IV pilus secretin PilQ n=1 Tax=Malikia spinosa TaxID=86180 RepID=UPI003FA30021